MDSGCEKILISFRLLQVFHNKTYASPSTDTDNTLDGRDYDLSLKIKLKKNGKKINDVQKNGTTTKAMISLVLSLTSHKFFFNMDRRSL